MVVAAPQAQLDDLAAAVARQLGPVVRVRVVATSFTVTGEPTGRGGPEGVAELCGAGEVAAAAGRARDAGATLLLLRTVSPDAPDGLDDLLRLVSADALVLAVDADSSRRRVRERITAIGTSCPVFLALTGCSTAGAPVTAAQVSGHATVALLDGRPASVGTWTGVLLDALLSQDDR